MEYTKVTKREILVSICIIAIMIVFGFLISNEIWNRKNDKNAEYNKAIKIETQDLFQYGMGTNAGNAFVYGKLKAVRFRNVSRNWWGICVYKKRLKNVIQCTQEQSPLEQGKIVILEQKHTGLGMKSKVKKFIVVR